MSGSHSSGEGKTNIERKVLRNTLISNSNYLKYKDESTSRPSALNMSSKLLNSITNSRNILSMDLSNITSDVFSISQSMQNFLFKPDIDPSHSETQLYTDIFLNSLYDLLTRSEPGTTVTLPDRHIILGSLHLSVPIILKGAPGTILEIRGGITVDLDEYPPQDHDENPRLVLCEMSIIFNCARNTDEAKQPALFTLNAKNTMLEVRDCDIKSVSNDLQNVTAEFEDISDVCFMVNSSSKEPYNQETYSSKLLIKSCNISNFFEVIRAGINCSVVIEKAHFAQSSGSCISIKSPREFSLTSSVIERAAKYGVIIKLTDDPHKFNMITEQQNFRYVKLDGNEIRGIGSCGVFISCETSSYVQPVITISNNKITNCKQDGITIKQLILHKLEISSNDLNCNKGTSIWLEKVTMASNGKNILLSYNRCFDSHSGYGIYLYDTCAELENNECFRNNLGGLMIVGSPNKENTGRLSDLLIKNCTMHTNGENGITILDYIKGSIKISTSKIHENYHNGVYLLQSHENTVVKRPSDKVLPIIGDVLIENSEIFLNKLYGITLSKILCTISTTIISDNQEGAISLDEESRKLLKFRDEDEGRLRQYIHGTIGGDWGKIHQDKKKGCGNNDCMLL